MYGQNPVVKTTLDRNEILIGEPFSLHIKILLPHSDYSLKGGGFPDSAQKLVVIKKGQIDSSLQSDYALYEQTIRLTSFDSGWVKIPSIEYVFQEENNPLITVATDSMKILVKYAPQDSILPFHDIKDIISVKVETPWWKWIAIGLSILLLIIGLIFFIKKYKQPKSVDTNKLGKNAFAEAMEALNALKNNLPQTPEDVKRFHTQLTDINKRYLTQRFGKSYFQKTTENILMDLKEILPDSHEIFDFANALKMSDAVKFAKWMPDNEQNKNCILAVEKMIQTLNGFHQKEANDF